MIAVDNYHTSVLLKEVLEYLKVKKGEKYIDGTLGGGGHSIKIAQLGGKVLAIDVDSDAINYVENKIKNEEKIKTNVKIVKGNFRRIGKLAIENGFEKVAGILFDLGVSMHQLKSVKRGFSFLNEAELDMRMDQDLSVKAKDLINILSQKELYEIFKNLGEEKLAWHMAQAIIRARKIKKIETTIELEKIIFKSNSLPNRNNNPATKIFQSLRMVVNSEIENLEEAIPEAETLLKKGGRLVIISFHSLEDRIVKNFFTEFERNNLGIVRTLKPILPSEKEIKENRSARSAKLRVFEKI